MKFMIHEGTHVNDKYIVTKQLFNLTCSIYFQPVKNSNTEAFGLANQIIDKAIDALQKSTTFTVNSLDKI